MPKLQKDVKGITYTHIANICYCSFQSSVVSRYNRNGRTWTS